MGPAAPDPDRFRNARRDPGLVVLEGLHALKHAIRFGAELIEAWTSDAGELRRLSEELAPDIADAALEIARPVDASLFERLAPRPHPTGVIALARRPAVDGGALLTGPGETPVLLLDRPTHHGNIGAAVRVAAAAAAGGVLVTGSHDPWHPSAVRGAAGLQFALPVTSLGPDGAARAADTGRPVVALDPSGDPLEAGAPPPGALLVFGSERTGVSGALLDRADRVVALPMRPGVSSLNLATAVAATLYLAGAPFGDRGRAPA